MKISDFFYRSSAIINDLFLYTGNKRDFSFIDEIKFFKEN